MRELAPVAAVVHFIDCINGGDVDGIAGMLADGYTLTVFDEEPQLGREQGVEGWRGYVRAFPGYTIYPERIAEADGVVAVLGYTTGSHLGLPEAEERELRLIWIASVAAGKIAAWALIADTAANRMRYHLA